MRKRSKKNAGQRLLTGYGIALIVISALGLSFVAARSGAILNILASSITSLGGTTTTIFFRAYGDRTLKQDGTTSIDVNINAKVPVNALGATISFPKDTIEVVGISKEKSFFDLWTEDTSISEDTGEIHFSGGTTKVGGIMGTGTVITLMVRARAPGTAELKFISVQVYPSDGSGDPLSTATHSISYTITERSEAGVISSSGAAVSAPAIGAPLQVNPDLNGDGRITLVDLSILTFKMLGTYDSRYDLNLNGSVGLDDLSILMAKI